MKKYEKPAVSMMAIESEVILGSEVGPGANDIGDPNGPQSGGPGATDVENPNGVIRSYSVWDEEEA